MNDSTNNNKFMDGLKRISKRLSQVWNGNHHRRSDNDPNKITLDIEDSKTTNGKKVENKNHHHKLEKLGGLFAKLEKNALNEEGIDIINHLSIEFENWAMDEFRSNVDDPFVLVEPLVVKISDYVLRLTKYCNIVGDYTNGGRESLGVRCAISCRIYLERLKDKKEYFLNINNIHQLIQAGFLIAIKLLQTKPISSTYWANVAGLDDSDQVEQLEESFRKLLEYQIKIEQKELDKWSNKFDLPEF